MDLRLGGLLKFCAHCNIGLRLWSAYQSFIAWNLPQIWEILRTEGGNFVKNWKILQANHRSPPGRHWANCWAQDEHAPADAWCKHATNCTNIHIDTRRVISRCGYESQGLAATSTTKYNNKICIESTCKPDIHLPSNMRWWWSGFTRW